ncbi:MAG: YopX family protein [Thermodesulfobacteriota bacterium]
MNRESRVIKFRAWQVEAEEMLSHDGIAFQNAFIADKAGIIILMQYTGLKDKNGVEIYELHEIDSVYRVEFRKDQYVLCEISSGDTIVSLYDYLLEDKAFAREITREYSPIPQDQERLSDESLS